MTDVIKAESSTAAVAEPEFNPADQYTWSPEQREHWNETGNPPEPPKKEKQESAPAVTPAKEANSEVATATKSAAETETASKGKKERKPGEKLSAEERIAQLTAKVHELEERGRSRETAPKPSSDPEPEKKAAEAPKRPNPFTWKGTVEEYEVAAEAWEGEQRRKAIQEFQANEAMKAQNQKLQGQLDEVKTKYPDAQEKIKVATETILKAPIPGVIRTMLDDSEVLPELMYVLADETTRSNFIEVASKNPGKAIRVLAQMEADIRSKATVKVEPEAKSEPETPPVPKPRAPKPPSEVGGRGAAAEDVLRSAATAGDYRTFEAEMNHRKFAKST